MVAFFGGVAFFDQRFDQFPPLVIGYTFPGFGLDRCADSFIIRRRIRRVFGRFDRY